MWFLEFFRRRKLKKDDRLGNFLRELENRPQSQILPSDVVKFSDPLRAVFNHATRTGQISLSEMTSILELTESEAQQVVDRIIDKGFFHTPSHLGDEPVYKPRLAVRTRRKEDVIPKDILKKLDEL